MDPAQVTVQWVFIECVEGIPFLRQNVHERKNCTRCFLAKPCSVERKIIRVFRLTMSDLTRDGSLLTMCGGSTTSSQGRTEVRRRRHVRTGGLSEANVLY